MKCETWEAWHCSSAEVMRCDVWLRCYVAMLSCSVAVLRCSVAVLRGQKMSFPPVPGRAVIRTVIAASSADRDSE